VNFRIFFSWIGDSGSDTKQLPTAECRAKMRGGCEKDPN
jgi:hypothetical protein